MGYILHIYIYIFVGMPSPMLNYKTHSWIALLKLFTIKNVHFIVSRFIIWRL